MNLKSYLIGMTIGAIVIGGVLVGTINHLKNEKEELLNINSKVEECSNIKEEKNKNLEIISSEKKYNDEYNVECYEVIMKNTSGRYLKKIEFSIGERNIWPLWYVTRWGI